MTKKIIIGVVIVIAAVLVATAIVFHLPASSPEGSVRGQVFLGPACPVERVPPEPGCAPRPYQTSVTISRNIETPENFMTVDNDVSGMFSVSLPAGEYVLHPVGGSPYPRCDEKLVDIVAGRTDDITINCDTGIR
jgi:hypothetical protein